MSDSVPAAAPAYADRRKGLRRVLLLGVPALLIAGGLLVAVLMGWVMPKQYESTAVIQVNGGWNDAPTGLGQAFAGDPTPEMLEVEARRVLGVPTFERVRERLALEQRWGGEVEEVMARLREAVKVRVVPDSNLIEITVRLGDATDARDVAHGMAVAHRDLRTEEEKAKAEKLLEALDVELEAQERAVEEKRREMERAMEETDFESEARADQVLIEELEGVQEELRSGLDALDSDLALLRQLHGESLYRHAASLDLPQNSAAVVYAEYEKVEKSIADLKKSGLGEAHPKFVAEELRLSLMQGELEHAIKEVREGMESHRKRVVMQMELVEGRLKKGVRRVYPGYDDLVYRTRPPGIQSEYTKGRSEYDSAQFQLQALRLQHSSQRVWLKVAQRGKIAMASSPWIAKEPVSPDREAYLVVGGGVGVGMAVVWVLGARWRGAGLGRTTWAS